MRRLALLALLALVALIVAGLLVPAARAAEGPAELSRLEAALAREPDSLRLANDYRRAVIRTGEYGRALEYFEKLLAGHPKSANAWLNYGYVYVDKIPVEGAITRVILANSAITQFSKSIELERSWVSLFTRGNAYLYWPKIFGRAPLGVADLEQAVAMSRQAPKRPYHVRAFIALGDGYWKIDQPDKARETWREGAKLFPGDPQLEARLSRNADDLAAFLDEQRDPAKRVDTDLSVLWAE